MKFLRGILARLPGGGSSSDDGLYIYIKIQRSGEIVRLRLHKGSEISRDDENRLFVRKLIMGSRSFERAEATLYFDSSFKVIEADISGGELSDEAAFLAQQAGTTSL